MGGVEWVVLSAIILLTAALLHLAKPKASDGSEHGGRASQPPSASEGSETHASSLPDIMAALASANVPEKDIAGLASFLNSPPCYPGMWTIEVLLENGFEFRGATKTAATFADSEGIRVIFTKDKWRMVWPNGQSLEHASLKLLGEIVDPWLRRM